MDDGEKKNHEETASTPIAFPTSGETIIGGWASIAAYLHMDVATVQEVAARPRDPLPVVHDYDGSVAAFATVLRDWRQRETFRAPTSKR